MLRYCLQDHDILDPCRGERSILDEDFLGFVHVARYVFH